MCDCHVTTDLRHISRCPLSRASIDGRRLRFKVGMLSLLLMPAVSGFVLAPQSGIALPLLASVNVASGPNMLQHVPATSLAVSTLPADALVFTHDQLLGTTTLMADAAGNWLSPAFDAAAAAAIPFVLFLLLFILFRLAKLFASAF